MASDILFLGGTSIDIIPLREENLFRASTGGSVTNTCAIAALLGLKTSLLSKIGKDPLGDFAVKELNSAGIDTSGVIRDGQIKTPLAIASRNKRGDSVYTFYKNSPADSIVPFKGTSKKLLKACQMFHVGSSFSYRKESSQEALKYLKYLKKRECFVSVDPNIRPYAVKDKAGAKKRLFSILEYADMARLSEADITFLTGQKDPRDALKKLRKMIKSEVVLTLGGKGSIYRDRDNRFVSFPAFKVKIADTIGAGDAFTAGMIYCVKVSGKEKVFGNIRPYLAFSSAVSAAVCTRYGAVNGLDSHFLGSSIKNFVPSI